jgi:hypothetical protein
VPEFLVERYVSQTDEDAVTRDADDALAASVEMTREGTPVRYLRSIFVPEDETCFLLYEAGSADAVRKAALRAGLTFERIAAATVQPKGETR